MMVRQGISPSEGDIFRLGPFGEDRSTEGVELTFSIDYFIEEAKCLSCGRGTGPSAVDWYGALTFNIYHLLCHNCFHDAIDMFNTHPGELAEVTSNCVVRLIRIPHRLGAIKNGEVRLDFLKGEHLYPGPLILLPWKVKCATPCDIKGEQEEKEIENEGDELKMALSQKDRDLVDRHFGPLIPYSTCKEHNVYTTLQKTSRSLAYFMVALCPDNRERALALTKLEEAVLWASVSLTVELSVEEELVQGGHKS